MDLNRCEGRQVIINSLKQLNFARETGRPMAGYMEQSLSNALAALT